jgi:hypothetical protein
MKRLLPVLMGFVFLLLSSTEGWSLPPCLGTPTDSYRLYAGFWTDCFGTLTFDSGEKYVGEWKDGKWNGKGTLTFASGEKEEELAAVSSSYVGEFKEGKRHGKGTYIYINGDKYVGEFKDNKRHGHGTYHHTSGNKYVGEYKDGKKNGQGAVTFVSGYKFVGAFKNGKVRWSQKMGSLTDKVPDSNGFKRSPKLQK